MQFPPWGFAKEGTGVVEFLHAYQSPEEGEGHGKKEIGHQSQIQRALEQGFALLLSDLPGSKRESGNENVSPYKVRYRNVHFHHVMSRPGR